MAIPTCTWVRSRLPLLAGGDALGHDLRHVERHLMRCAACRSRLQALRDSQAVLAEAAAADPVDELGPSLWPALAEQIRTSPRPAVRSAWSLDPRDAWPRRRRGWLLPGLGLAAALLVGLGSFALAPRLGWSPVATSSQPKPASPVPDRLLRYSDEELAQMRAAQGKRRAAPVYARREVPESPAPAARSSRDSRPSLTQ